MSWESVEVAGKCGGNTANMFRILPLRGLRLSGISPNRAFIQRHHSYLNLAMTAHFRHSIGDMPVSLQTGLT